MQTIVYAQSLVQDLRHTLAQIAKPDAVVWLFDANTHQLCAPLLQEFLQNDVKIIVRAGDVHKDLSALSEVWGGLQSAAATRHSLLVNVGGGMLTDLGGFAAATYKTWHPFYQCANDTSRHGRRCCRRKNRSKTLEG